MEANKVKISRTLAADCEYLIKTNKALAEQSFGNTNCTLHASTLQKQVVFILLTTNMDYIEALNYIRTLQNTNITDFIMGIVKVV